MKILIPYDGSRFSLDALGWVGSMALNPESEVLILSVISEPKASFLTVYNEKMLLRQEAVAEKSRELRALTEELIRKRSDCKINYRIHFGNPASAILGTADEWNANLIVMASHPRSKWGRLIKGSVSHAVLNRANCSVLVVRPTEDVEHGSIGADGYRLLVPIQGSIYSQETIDWLTSQVWRTGTQIKMLMAMPEFDDLNKCDLPAEEHEDMLNRFQHFKESAFELLENPALKLGSVVGNEHISIDVRPGKPEQVILDQVTTWKPDIIAMGSPVHGSLDGIFGSAVPQYVLDHCNCSVLIVKRMAGSKQWNNKLSQNNTFSLGDFLCYAAPQSRGDHDVSPHGLFF
ncbi:MAG: universal stress protein [Cyanobacteria bacterium]|nr:universal stress protein [Cyanobacteriota bacterium]